MYLETLLKDVDVITYKGSLSHNINALSIDSRKIEKGTLYITLAGIKTDGQNFIQSAIEKGAIAILCEKDWLDNQTDLNDSVAYIAVENRKKAFAKISSNFYENPSSKMFMIGITGTNGKTTTTHIIEDILKEQNKNVGLLGTIYYRYGNTQKKTKYTTPLANELQEIFKEMVDNDVTHLVMETSSHALEQSRIDYCEYDVAMFSNLTQDHLDYHKTIENYRDAKLILFEQLLKQDGISILNYDDPSFEYFKKSSLNRLSNGNIITYGISHDADIFADNIKLNMDGTSFRLNTPSEKLEINLNLLGKFNVYNTLSALAFGYAMKIPMEICKRAVEKINGVSGRIEIVTPKSNPYTVVVDYAHTPDGLINILSSTKEFTKNRVISVFGCGGDRDKTKRPIMGEIGYRISDIEIITSDNPRTEEPMSIIEDILNGIPNKDKVIVEPDRKEAIRKAISIAKEGDTVVIAGKGHEDYQIFKDKTIHFDDREIAREIIASFS